MRTFQHNKVYLWQTYCQWYITWEKDWKYCKLNQGDKISLSIFVVNIVLEDFTRGIRHEKEIKDIYNMTERGQNISIWRLYNSKIRTCKNSDRKILKFINNFSKVKVYTISIPKLVTFLYASNDSAKEWIIPFEIASKITLEYI